MASRLKNANSYFGQKYNYLTINKLDEKASENGYKFICTCDCGREVKDYPRQVIMGFKKTCGVKGCKFFHQVRVDSSKKSSIGSFTGHGKIYGSRWASWRIGAEKRGIDFNVSIEYAWSIFIKQNGKCALSGIEIDFDGKWNSNKTTASLDRIDSSRGYVEGNIQWVHKTLNLMKRDMSDEEFTEWCKAVFLHRKALDERRV